MSAGEPNIQLWVEFPLEHCHDVPESSQDTFTGKYAKPPLKYYGTWMGRFQRVQRQRRSRYRLHSPGRVIGPLGHLVHRLAHTYRRALFKKHICPSALPGWWAVQGFGRLLVVRLVVPLVAKRSARRGDERWRPIADERLQWLDSGPQAALLSTVDLRHPPAIFVENQELLTKLSPTTSHRVSECSLCSFSFQEITLS